MPGVSNAFRVAGAGRIDRARPVDFAFNGRRLQGFAGDSLASALLANGIHMVARSLKYHRPRGVLSAGHEEPNALVQLERGAFTEPNRRATEVELYEGLDAWSVNCFPSLHFDLRAIQALAAPILVAGFYNKTFKWPRTLWKRVYEPAIRAASGLGSAPTAGDPDLYDRMHWHCDVLVIGAGPAGLSAALPVARTGLRVVLLEEASEPGGSLLGRDSRVEGVDGAEWAARVAAELDGMRNVLFLRRASAFGYFDHNYLVALERRTDHLGPGRAPGIARQRLWHLRARRVVLANGAYERPIVFGNNDLPGIMLAGAACWYAYRFGVAAGRAGVAFVNNDAGFRFALDTQALVHNITHVVDVRSTVGTELASRAAELGIEVLAGHLVTHAQGRRRVRGVTVQREAGGSARTIACDHVLVSGGLSPALQLFAQAGGSQRYDEALACFRAQHARQAVEIAGAANARFSLTAALADGAAAAARTLASLGREVDAELEAESDRDLHLRPLWSVQALLGRRIAGRHFVDLQNDVSEDDIRLAVREGFGSVEHAKRYTTAGMATDQGKTSGLMTVAILADALGKPIRDVGLTTFRPPSAPVSFGALAGRDRGELFDPVRTTVIHEAHIASGAVFEDVGQWKRPLYFPRSGESMRAAVLRECLAVRTTAGIIDASTLGKIDIQGPDAIEFLNRVYTNAWDGLSIGGCRYGLMCSADGMVMDDGVTARLAADRFLMTTTTGNAARVLDWLEEWLQTEWHELKVFCTSVTEQWATVSVAGPKARRILQALAPRMDLSCAAFPFMTFREGVVAGIPARVFRISFTGELSYEINVPAWHGLALWSALMEAGRPHGLTPYGTETMHVLRAEKGYIIIGQDTDGTVTPRDLGMDRIVSRQKDFIGKRSFDREHMHRADRKQLVGLLPHDPEFVAREGAQLIGDSGHTATGRTPDVPSLGHVTSSYHSPNLGRSFALGLLAAGRQRHGQTVHCVTEHGVEAVNVTAPVFFDVEGARRDGID